jgi:hypothetical protein
MSIEVAQNVEASLIVVPEKRFYAWKKHYIRTVFLDKRDKYFYLSTSFIDAYAISKTFPETHYFIPVINSATIAHVLEVIVRKFIFNLSWITGNKARLIRNDKSIAIREEYSTLEKTIEYTLEFSLLCPALSYQSLDLSTKLSELNIIDGSEEVFVLKENINLPLIEGSGMTIVRGFTEFQAAIAAYEDLAQVDDYLYHLYFHRGYFHDFPLIGVLLYTDEDIELSTYIRENFDNLHSMSGKEVEIFFIEEPPTNSTNLAPHFWKTKLERAAYRTWSLLGWVRSKPYDKSAAYKIADSLGIYSDQLPCIVLFDEISQAEKIVVSIPNNFSRFFRDYFANSKRYLNRVKESMDRNIDESDGDEFLERSFNLPFIKRTQIFEELKKILVQDKAFNTPERSVESVECIKDNYNIYQHIRADSMDNNPGGISQSNSGQMSGGMQVNTGDNSQQTMMSEVAADRMPTNPEVIEMLAQLEEVIQSSALLEADKEKAKTYLDAAKTEAEEEEPDKELVAKSLERATKTLKAADEAMEAGSSLFEKFAPTVKAIAPWLGRAAGALLSLL